MKRTENDKSGKKIVRYPFLDTIRGITLVSMILYHSCWDAVYLLRAPWKWYEGYGAFLWQQSICWTFILLSGFCIPFSKRLFRRGLQVFGAGLLVTAVTLLALPEDRVVFGVLTLLGSCMLLIAGWRKFRDQRAAGRPGHPGIGLVVCALLFALTRPINSGYLWLGTQIRLPGAWYSNLFTTYLGFPMPGFFSTDYFSLLPWLFLYLCGAFFCKLCRERGWLRHPVLLWNCPPFSFLGRHSLLVYLLHQPVLYLGVLLIQTLRG